MSYQSDWKDESLTREEVEALPGRTLLEFGAEWCPHCQAVQESLEQHLADTSIRHLKIADGKGKRLGRAFRVKLWPNFVLLKNGQVQMQLARPEPAELQDLLRQIS